MYHAKEHEKESERRLGLQKQEYESTIKRHLSFIDQVCLFVCPSVSVCMLACVCACLCVCMLACVRVCVIQYNSRIISSTAN